MKTTTNFGILLALSGGFLIPGALPAYSANNSEQVGKASTGSSAAAVNGSDTALLKQARSSKTMFEDEEAIKLYSTYLTKHPNDDDVRLERADALNNEHRWDELIVEYQRLSNSKNANIACTAAANLGKVYQKQKRYPEAIKYFKLARKLGATTLLTEMSDCARESGDGQLALEISVEITKREGEMAGREHRARALMTLKQPRNALIDFDFLIKKEMEIIARTDKESRKIYVETGKLTVLLGERAECYEVLKDTKRALQDKATKRKFEQELYNESPFLTKDK